MRISQRTKALDARAIQGMLKADDDYALEDYLKDNGLESSAANIINILKDIASYEFDPTATGMRIEAVVNRLNQMIAEQGYHTELETPQWEERERNDGEIEYLLKRPQGDYYVIALTIELNPELEGQIYRIRIWDPSVNFTQGIPNSQGTLEECMSKCERWWYQEVLEYYS